MTQRFHARGRRAASLTVAALAASAAAAAMIGAPGVARPAAQHQSRLHPSAQGPTCHLGHGVKHVIDIVFDNVHFFRDNPNVPSDLEQMPHLLHFLKTNGTLFSNSHTPLIGHTADDSLTIYTGLYGDRHGQPLTNSYKTYNPNGTTDPAASFAYWTSPVYDTATTPTAGHDTSPTMVYSPTVPAKVGHTGRVTPAPWVPFTRAGCNVGDFSTANMVLENTGVDLPNVFGPNSPEVKQYKNDTDPYKDPEVADYVGVAVHCAKGAAFCADATGVKYGQKKRTHTAVADKLPTEPGGYHGFQALFGARYVGPRLGAGTPNLKSHGYPVTDSNGVLTDINGQPIMNTYANQPGFPGFSPTAAQTLAYVADMQENGVPVTYAYISDLHERKAGSSSCTTSTATGTGYAVGPGDSCYVDNARAYDQAFQKFFDRLKKDGITPANTEFVIGAEENDQFAGANVGRAIQPTPTGCDGLTTPCNYNAGQIGELQTNIYGELSSTPSNSTQFDIEPQGASIYVHGNPGMRNPTVRQLERDTAAMTADNPYSGETGQHIVKYQADRVEERILHMRTADGKRFPTYSLFPVPDYYFSTSGSPNVTINPRYAWNHGYYSPNINITWVGFVGPGVARHGVDGPRAAQGNEAHDPNSTNTVPEASTRGTWVEETDIRPTLLHLVGLRDDYQSDGAVVTAALRSPSAALRKVRGMLGVYQQLNSSVGEFATETLIADSRAMASGTSGHFVAYRKVMRRLLQLANERDALATTMKEQLSDAAQGSAPGPRVRRAEIQHAQALLYQAYHLALHS